MQKEDYTIAGHGRVCLVFLATLLLGVPGNSRAAEEGVRNVGFVARGQKIEVTYDLEGKGTYAVSLHLLGEAGQDTVATPQAVSGDVGQEVEPGKNKKIVWDVLKDVESLEGSGFVFEVRAVRLGGISKWVFIGGAGIAAGAGAVMSMGGGEEKKGTIVIEVPDPEE